MPPFAAPTQPPPSAFRELQAVFRRIHRGDRVFVGTGCGEPQHLVAALVDYVEHNPRAIVDAEVIHVWSLGLAPYAGQRLCHNFRHNSFFIGDSTREAVNAGLADYTPVLLSRVPDLMRRGVVPIDVALVQASPPDEHGAMSLGISVDIVRAAIEAARTVIVQVNAEMPRVHGDSFLWLDEVDHVVAHDEPLLEFSTSSDDEVVRRIGAHVSSLIRDGDTIQVGYGSIPNAVLAGLHDKRHLGVHTTRTDMHHERLQEFVAIDYTRQMVLLATIPRGDGGQEQVVGLGQYSMLSQSHIAEIGFVVRDEYQRRGIGTEMLRHLTTLARRRGIFGFTAEVLLTNAPMLRLLDRAGFDMERTEGFDAGLVCQLRLLFPGPEDAAAREVSGQREAEGLSPDRGSGRAPGRGPPDPPGS